MKLEPLLQANPAVFDVGARDDTWPDGSALPGIVGPIANPEEDVFAEFEDRATRRTSLLDEILRQTNGDAGIGGFGSAHEPR